MARKKINDSGGGPNWMDTYADMVTLLLTFFVMLFAMSTVDSTKWKQLVKAFSGDEVAEAQGYPEITDLDSSLSDLDVVGSSSEISEEPENKDIQSADQVKSLNDLYWYMKNYINKNGLDASIGVHKGDGYTFIMFQNRIFFDGDSAEIRDDGKVVLDFLSDAIKNIPDQIGEIRVYGHTAETENSLKTQQRIFDRNLSSQRANNVLLYIDLKDIIESRKMVAEGYGEYRPLVPHNGTEENRIKNRRVELLLLESEMADSKLDSIYKEINNQENAEK